MLMKEFGIVLLPVYHMCRRHENFRIKDGISFMVIHSGFIGPILYQQMSEDQ